MEENEEGESEKAEEGEIVSGESEEKSDVQVEQVTA